MPSAIALTSLVSAAAVMAWRMRETKRPVTLRKIVIPPIAMSTGLSMFIEPKMRVPFTWGLAAFALGVVVFSYPLIKTSSLTLRDGVVWLERSRAFLWILVGLVAVRLLLRSYVERYIDPLQTAALFFLLAFGMIVRWRIGMYQRYRELTRV